MIRPLQPLKTLQSTSWKWHQLARCQQRKRKFYYNLIIQFSNWACIVLAKELTFIFFNCITKEQQQMVKLNARTAQDISPQCISGSLAWNITCECKECWNKHDGMMLVAVSDVWCWYFSFCTLVTCWPCKKPFHFIFYILLFLLKRPECLIDSNNILLTQHSRVLSLACTLFCSTFFTVYPIKISKFVK